MKWTKILWCVYPDHCYHWAMSYHSYWHPAEGGGWFNWPPDCARFILASCCFDPRFFPKNFQLLNWCWFSSSDYLREPCKQKNFPYAAKNSNHLLKLNLQWTMMKTKIIHRNSTICKAKTIQSLWPLCLKNSMCHYIFFSMCTSITGFTILKT